MLIKIPRPTCLNKWPNFPLKWYDEIKEEIDYFYPKVYYSYILTLQSKTFKTNAKLLGIELAQLAKACEFESLIFLGDTDTAWLYQGSQYKPVAEAIEFLKSQKVGKRFNGALEVSCGSLLEFIPHLSWLSRCNAALPYFYFTDTKQSILGTICQYGNIHFDTFNKSTDNIFHRAHSKTNFELLKNEICSERFSKSGAIKGRIIKT